MTIKKALPILIGSLAPIVGTADILLDPVVVTPTRTAISADDSLVPVVVITADDIEQTRATSVADILATQAGIDVGQNGVDGGNASVFVRGTESDHVLVLVDGIKINFAGTSGGGTNFQHIDPSNIERIEIIKGPRSTLYGSEALGGVIHIITKKGQRTNVTVTAETGANNTNRGAINAAYREKDIKIYGNASRHTTDGQPVFVNDGTPGDNGDRGFERETYGLGVGWIAGNITFDANHQQSQGNTEYTSFSAGSFSPQEQAFKQQTTAISANFDATNAWAMKLVAGLAEDDIQQKRSTDRAQTRRKSLDWQNDIEFGSSILTWGLYLENKKEVASGFSSYSRGIQTRAFYLQNQSTWGKNQALVGVRFNKENKSNDSHHTFNAEFGRDLGNVVMTTGVGTAVRAPTIGELFGNPFFSNPNLKTEESTNLEFGLKTKRTNGHQLYGTLFRNEIDNLITFNSAFSLDNVGQTRIKGLELGWSFIGSSVDASVNYTLQDPRNLDTDTQLLRRARQILTTSFTWKGDDFKAGFTTTSRGKRPDINGTTFASDSTKSYHLINLHTAYDITPQWSINGKIENALDTDYELVRSYDTRGRSLFLGVKYQLR